MIVSNLLGRKARTTATNKLMEIVGVFTYKGVPLLILQTESGALFHEIANRVVVVEGE